MRRENHLLSEAESRKVIDDINAWCRRTGTNYNRLVTAARVGPGKRYDVIVRGRRLTTDTAAKLRAAMLAHRNGIEKGEHKARIRANARELLERQRAKHRRDYPAAAVKVDRTPCDRCGARRDVGCKHHPRF